MLTFFLMLMTCQVLSAARFDTSVYSDLHARARKYLTDRGKEGGNDITRDLTSSLSQLQDEFSETIPRILNGFLDQEIVNVSWKCANDTLTVLAGVEQQQTWALRMLDAMGKPGSGLRDGSILWLGSYDECLSTTAVDKAQRTLFDTRYCRIQLLPDAVAKQGTDGFMGLFPTLGLCVPDACGNTDITLVANELLLQLKLKNITAQVICQERQLQLDTKAVVAICVCVIFVTLMVLGTVYDVCIQQKKDVVYRSKTPTDKTPLLNKEEDSEKVTINDVNTSMSSTKVHRKQLPVTVPHDDGKPAIWLKLLGAFSVYTNGAKLLNTEQPTGSLTAVHGIRFMSMTWVVLGHSYFVVLSVSGNLQPFLKESISNWTFHTILNALVAVDTFFTMSGLLVVYLIITEMKKSEGRVNWVMFYFHRFWRLTPVYMCVLMLDVCLLRYVSDGPMWPQGGIELNACRDTWWTNLLYINNLVKRDSMCFGWSWYLADDMQFYVLSPLIIIPLFFRKLLGFAVLAVFLLVTITSAGLVTRLVGIPAGFVYQTKGVVFDPLKFNDYYYTPYCRMGPYLVGMAAGYILAKSSCRVKMNKVVSLGGWCVAAVAALAVLYGPYESANGTPMTPDVNAFYNAVHRTVWGAAVSWVIFACATGHGGFVNKFLSWKGFVPLSRLTYSAYLVHMLLLVTFALSQRTPVYISNFNIAYQFFGHLIASYSAAFLVSLTFESPMMGLERVLFKRKTK
ncbi:nose resistant to fluoxetine protein 6-like [Gigantopelta aegis]|uniref:nose resistant to fluoxetine protein 6-like n=1 Tax=Gigantopelta aegis TaxID=1735272 RepID=UPI001B88C845|nr:nose resistant to fluoxetine protein 6-like [Gigantopelta aegis]